MVPMKIVKSWPFIIKGKRDTWSRNFLDWVDQRQFTSESDARLNNVTLTLWEELGAA